MTFNEIVKWMRSTYDGPGDKFIVLFAGQYGHAAMVSTMDDPWPAVEYFNTLRTRPGGRSMLPGDIGITQDRRGKAMSGATMMRTIEVPNPPLCPSTERLVRDFATALAAKLKAAEDKYGYDTGWARDDWEGQCQADLRMHVEKGDPLDVAAYAAFCWFHKWRT